jgi:signal transduction histidine kinase
MAQSGGVIEVRVRDDGRGFDPAETAGRHGMGLGVMRERIGELGGTLEVDSEPGRGSTVLARIPVTAPAPAGAEGAS